MEQTIGSNYNGAKAGADVVASFAEKKAAAWNRHIHERLAEPLRPETLKSVLLIVPGSSGDAVLATTLIRWIKERNSRCRVLFAVKKSVLPIAEMCPGVDEAFECAPKPMMDPFSRWHSLAENEGRADVVAYPICDPEDMDLLRWYNFMETIWLLAGVEGGVPHSPLKLWLEAPDAAATAERVLGRCVSADFAAALAAQARRQPAAVFSHLLHKRTIRNAGWKNGARLRRYASEVRRLSAQGLSADPAKRFVIISNEANAFPAPAKGIFEAIIQFMRERGRVVLQNVLDPIHALPGTIPLVCTYEEFLSLRTVGIPFVGWRSGLCDIAAAAPAPMGVLCPSSFKGCVLKMRAVMEKPLDSFGFASMNVETDCVELVCDNTADLDFEKLASILR